MSRQRVRLRAPLLILGVYVLAALAMTWPLPLQFTSALPGVGGDGWSYLWAVGWPRTALLTGADLFHTDYIYYPLGGATQSFWAVSLLGALALPLLALFEPLTVHNLLYLGATVMTAYGVFLLAREVLRRIPGLSCPGAIGPAFLSGLAFAFGPLRLGYGLAFLNLYNTELVPFYLLALLLTLRRKSWRLAAAAGILLGLNVYLDFQLAAFLVVLTALLLVWALLVERPYGIGWRVCRSNPLARLAVVALVSLGIAAPMLWAVQREFALEGGNYIRVYPLRYSADRSYDLLSYFLPHARSALYTQLPSPQIKGVNASLSLEGESHLSPDRQAFLGYTVLALALVGVIAHPRRTFSWLGIGVLFGLASLGPVLRLAGESIQAPMPFALLHEVPLLNHIRIPMRYGLGVLLSFSILTCFGAARLSLAAGTDWRASSFTALAGLLILAEAAILPYPTRPFSPPRFYERLARESGDFAILEIPSFYWRDASTVEAFQILHHKRLLRAYSNRIAPDLADYFSLRQTPVAVRALRLLEGGESEPPTEAELASLRAADASIANEVLTFFNLRYAILHLDMVTPVRIVQLEDYIRTVLRGRVVEEDRNAVLYALPVSSPGDRREHLSTENDLALLYLGRGWQSEPLAEIEGEKARWAKGEVSEIYIPSAGGTRVLFLSLGCRTPATVRLEWNGIEMGALDLPVGWSDHDLTLPLGTVKAGMNRLVLTFPVSLREACALGELGWE